MAKRRSARLQKATKAPSLSPSPQSTSIYNHLPSVSEQNEPPAATRTPEKSSMADFSSITTRTPRNRTPIRPSGADMHPHHHKTSTAKPLEEARWLGFLAKGAHTAPAKNGSEMAVAQSTPTRGSDRTTNPFSTPNFLFRHKPPSMDLSPEAQRMMEDSRAEAQAIRSQLFARHNIPSIGNHSTRKMATPKGKASRFSDIHMAQFKKMDSIATHPSLLRTDPNRFSSAKTSLKRSPSKAELDTCNETPKPVPIPGKHLLSTDTTKKSTCALVQTEPTIHFGDETSRPTKRMKRHVNDDASATRTTIEKNVHEGNMPVTPRGPTHRIPGSAIPRFSSRLFTPTKASLARAQSAKAMKTYMLPSILRSPSTTTPRAAKSSEDSLKEGIHRTSHSLLGLSGVKSILRTPNRKFSNDPMKVAAGTHMSPPPGLHLDIGLPMIPATVPIQKHVNFTASTVAKDELVATPSRNVTERAISEVPQSSTVTYPALPSGVDLTSITLPRTLTLGDLPDSMPGSFTFRSEKAVDFGHATNGLQRPGGLARAGTIRQVGSNDAHDVNREVEGGSRKRRWEMVDEEFDKELNKENVSQGGLQRANKRSKGNPKTTLPTTPARKLPRRLDRRTGLLTPARLNMLATPKRRLG